MRPDYETRNNGRTFRISNNQFPGEQQKNSTRDKQDDTPTESRSTARPCVILNLRLVPEQNTNRRNETFKELPPRGA